MVDLTAIDDWPVDNAAAAALKRGVESTRGDIDRLFPLASLTKLITALAVLVACEEGTLALDSVVTEQGATVADLLAHAGGIAPDESDSMAQPRVRRIYSTAAYDILGRRLAADSAMTYTAYVNEAVLGPAEMNSTIIEGSPGSGAKSTVRDLIKLAECWTEPIIVSRATLDSATSAHLPHLCGVVPGYGSHAPNPWGLGPEIRGMKSPHWTGSLNSPRSFGHFGRSGTMMWMDDEADATLICLTDRQFGPWAIDAWPKLSDSVILGS